MDLLGGYNSGSDDAPSEEEEPQPRAAVPSAQLFTSSRPPDPPITGQTAPSTSGGGGLLSKLAQLPSPSAPARGIVTFKLPVQMSALQRGGGAKKGSAGAGGNSSSDEEERPTKRVRNAGPMRLKDFLPAPKHLPQQEEGVLGRGGGSGILGGGASSTNSQVQLPPDFFEGGTAPEDAEEDPQLPGSSSGAGAGYSNEAFRLDVAAGAGEYLVAGSGGGQGARATAGYHGAGRPGLQQQETGDMDLGEAILAEALREEQEKEARRGGGLSAASSAAAMNFKEVQADKLKYVDPSMKAAASGASVALGTEHTLQMRSEAKAHAGDKLARRKHQIGTLFYQAQMQELEQMERKGAGMKARSQTQAKYGW